MGFAPLNIKPRTPKWRGVTYTSIKKIASLLLKNSGSNIKKTCGSTPIAPCPAGAMVAVSRSGENSPLRPIGHLASSRGVTYTPIKKIASLLLKKMR